MEMKKLHGLIVVMVTICLCATSGLSVKDARIHMINDLGPDAVIDIHCQVDKKDLGHQQISYNWECQWWFNQFYPSDLECEANMPGAPQLSFMAFSIISCHYDGTGNCDWKFTPQGLFQQISGKWEFRYKWP